jgi:hypothetical protein
MHMPRPVHLALVGPGRNGCETAVIRVAAMPNLTRRFPSHRSAFIQDSEPFLLAPGKPEVTIETRCCGAGKPLFAGF